MLRYTIGNGQFDTFPLGCNNDLIEIKVCILSQGYSVEAVDTRNLVEMKFEAGS